METYNPKEKGMRVHPPRSTIARAKRLHQKYERTLADADEAMADRDAAIVEALASGWTQREVSQETGLSAIRIRQIAGKSRQSQPKLNNR